MKEFLLEVIFALVVFCSLYNIGSQTDGISAPLSTVANVESATFAEGSDLGLAISANVFGLDASVADINVTVPFPLPRLQRG